MRNTLIRQALYVPVLYFGTIIIAGLFAHEYSHIGQHASELAINSSKTAANIFTIGILLSGLSLVLYGLGLLLKFKKQFIVTAFLICVFGITFLFGAFYKIGSPWHGLYGIGLSVMMLPFALLYEAGKKNIDHITKIISIISALAIFLYFWAMIAGLDPIEQRGLTQRIFGLFVFGYISFSAYKLNSLERL